MGQASRHSSAASFAQGLTRLQSRCQLGLWSLLRLGVPFQAYVVVGSLHFLAAVEIMAACFFKVNGRECVSDI